MIVKNYAKVIIDYHINLIGGITMPRNPRKHNFNQFSDQEKDKLKNVKKELAEAQKKEPESLREHLQAFNDGVMAIIITIIVLEIQPALHEIHYQQFISNIAVFLITFLLWQISGMTCIYLFHTIFLNLQERSQFSISFS